MRFKTTSEGLKISNEIFFQKKSGGIFYKTIKIIKTAAAFIKREAALSISAAAAVITSFIIPPDAKYYEYIDYKTLTCLYCKSHNIY